MAHGGGPLQGVLAPLPTRGGAGAFLRKPTKGGVAEPAWNNAPLLPPGLELGQGGPVANAVWGKGGWEEQERGYPSHAHAACRRR
eukprot:scaffold2266_cov112-Isochrysis_galbana.AAC.4